ncbi:putative phosphatidylinositol-3,4,5-trisphosphate 3-phosphatase [Aspergillus foveolatus]|uniref:putative phosphatidylinositol-3,4,5-trisphosphate 3-phosphatase n=1 Tax=Aspergillus foveolatus TaxID=210207 RepID=UPI003CCDBEAE
MASILRQLVAGPRLQHPETGLDLCYVADNIIATSGPSTNYPKLAYRTPLKQLVNFLDSKHGADWCIWEFRAEGTGYPDSEVHGRIHHFPFPDHHPPPFALIPKVMASMRNWLQRLDGSGADGQENQRKGQRIAVVHCKAGKGRSGTMACSYLISQEGWKMEDALQRFTERRMRVGFGSGVSIPSQLRWVRYVNRWTNELGKRYVERPVEILEIHVWGLRDGVKVVVEGFVEEGQKIKQFHLFRKDERTVMSDSTLQSQSSQQSSNTTSEDDEDNKVSSNNDNNSKTNPKQKLNAAKPSGTRDQVQEQQPISATESDSSLLSTTTPASNSTSTTPTTTTTSQPPQKHTHAVLLRPSSPLILPSPDINIDFERRSKAASYTGLAMVTSIAHVWFNPYFEGGDKYDSGVFEINWDAMDGIKGTSRKGIKALDRLKVVWRYAGDNTTEVEDAHAQKRPVSRGVIMEPKPGEPIPETRVKDWRLKDSRHGGGDETEEDKVDVDSSSSDGEGSVGTAREKEKENVPMAGGKSPGGG